MQQGGPPPPAAWPRGRRPSLADAADPCFGPVPGEPHALGHIESVFDTLLASLAAEHQRVATWATQLERENQALRLDAGRPRRTSFSSAPAGALHPATAAQSSRRLSKQNGLSHGGEAAPQGPGGSGCEKRPVDHGSGSAGGPHSDEHSTYLASSVGGQEPPKTSRASSIRGREGLEMYKQATHKDRTCNPAGRSVRYTMTLEQTDVQRAPCASRQGHKAPAFMIIPNSPRRTIIDFGSVAVLLYESLVWPYILAYDVSLEGWSKYMAILCSSFWTVDIVFSFVTGYQDGETIVLSPIKVARRYIASRFFIDLLVVTCDWITILAEAASSSSIYLKILRLLKANRILKIVIMQKFLRNSFVIANLKVRLRMVINSDILVLGSHVVQVMFVLLWLNHWGCCLWFAIGKYGPSDTGNHWVDRYEPASDTYFYAISLSWSISQMISASSDVLAMNSIERNIGTAWCILGLVCVSSLISSLSSTMMRLNLVNQERSEQLRLLHTFCLQRRVQIPICVLVQQQVMERLSQETRLTERDVPLLQTLSSSLRAQLRDCLYREHIARHPMMAAWSQVDETLLKDICFQTVQLVALSAGEELFTPGMNADAAHKVISGRLTYAPDLPLGLEDANDLISGQMISHLSSCATSAPLVVRDNSAPILAGQWLGELTLWIEWFHKGWAEAETTAEIISLSVSELYEVLRMHKAVAQLALAYRDALVSLLKQDLDRFLDDLSLGVEHECVVMAMSKQERMALSMPALTALNEPSWLLGFMFTRSSGRRPTSAPASQTWTITDEVDSGSCMLIKDPSGKVVRVVQVVALRLRLEGDEGQVLVQVGDSGAAADVSRAKCVLPGMRIGPGVSASMAVQELLEAELGPLAPHVTLEDYQVCRETVQPTQQQEVETEFVRFVFNATLDVPVEPLVTVLVSDAKALRPPPSRREPAKDRGRKQRQDQDENLAAAIFQVLGANKARGHLSLPDAATTAPGSPCGEDRAHSRARLFTGVLAQDLDQLVQLAGAAETREWVHVWLRESLAASRPAMLRRGSSTLSTSSCEGPEEEDEIISEHSPGQLPAPPLHGEAADSEAPVPREPEPSVAAAGGKRLLSL